MRKDKVSDKPIAIELRELDKQNYREILKLKVTHEQTGLVASNAISLAQAHFHETAWYRGIYAGPKAVGFVMLEIDLKKPEYYLWRFMIEADHQSLGYGYQSMLLVIDAVKSMPMARELLLSYVPIDGSPKKFYEKLGFLETGDIEEGEIMMSLQLK